MRYAIFVLFVLLIGCAKENPVAPKPIPPPIEPKTTLDSILATKNYDSTIVRFIKTWYKKWDCKAAIDVSGQYAQYAFMVDFGNIPNQSMQFATQDLYDTIHAAYPRSFVAFVQFETIWEISIYKDGHLVVHQ